jgi:hypothetical protein
VTTPSNARDDVAATERASRSRPSSRDAVKRLAISLRLLERRRRERGQFADMLSKLQGTNLVPVAGEEGLIAAVDSRLEEASQILNGLESDATTIGDALNELGAVLDGYEWEVIDDVMPELRRKAEEQDQLIGKLLASVDEWTSRLDPVRMGIDEALLVRAPVARERAAVDRMIGLVTAAQRALSDRRYTDVNAPIQQLAESEESPEMLAERVQDKITATQRFSGRAEVLLLHSIVDDLHSYTVLLRTPSEVGTQGFNIQDSSSLVDQDRGYIREAIAQITRAVDLGIARAFRPSAETGGQASSSQPVDTVRDLMPLPPESPEGTTTPEDLPTLISEVGEVMFRLIAPDRMRQYLSSNPSSLTITTDDLELPWELMYDESLEDSSSEVGLGFLCLQRPIARMPMGRAFPRLRPVTRQKAKLRFLLIYADPDQNLAAAEREIDKIKSALEPGSRGSNDDIEVTTLRREEVTGEKLNKALLTGRYDVIHFAGHAAFSEVDPDLSGLVLHKHERFLSQKIERFVEGQPLVFLNACQTGRTANADAPQRVGEYFWKPAEGLASAFLYGGALGCVGSLWPVYDDPAAEFAIEFYNQVLEGQMLGEAMRLARRTTREKHPDSITWASFVLYGDPTYRLVR